MGNTTQPQPSPPVSDVTEPANPTETRLPPPIPTYQSPNHSPLTPNNIVNSPPESQKKPSFLFPLILSFIFLTITTLFGVGSYVIAYEKIELPEKYQNIQAAVSNFVMSIPFMPKTPKYIFAKAVIAQEKIKKESYDISIAADSDSFTQIPGLGAVDVQAKGVVDYSDPTDVKFSVNTFLTKDFNFEIKRPEKLVYFRINKVPNFLLSFIGINTTSLEPILNKWYSYDPTPLETEARKEISSGDKEVPSQEFITANLNSYVDDKIFSEMKVSNSTVDGFAVYKVGLVADKELIDYIGRKIDEVEKKDATKLSDMVKSLYWEVDIDKHDFYIRKALVKAQLETDEISSYGDILMGTKSVTSGSSKVDISFAAKFSDFGKDVVIETPTTSEDWETFTNTISEIVREQYLSSYENTVSPTAKARDAKRLQDMLTLQRALAYYHSDCGMYPPELDALTLDPVPKNCPKQPNPSGSYIAEIPTDILGKAYFYKVSGSNLSYDLCTLLELPEDPSKNTCPDASYNYHLTTPEE